MAKSKKKKMQLQLSKIDLATESGAKTEFKILNKGITETTKGNLLFDDQAAELVMKAYEDYGNDLYIDYNHDFKEAAGWFQPEVRDGELWAGNVKWTEKALEFFAKREYRYFSPTIGFIVGDQNNLLVTELINLALVNAPATKKQEALAASNKVENMSDENPEVKQEPEAKEDLATAEDKPALEQLKQFLVDGNTEEAMKIVDELIAQAAADEGDGEDPPADPPAEESNKDSAGLSNQSDKVLELTSKLNEKALELDKKELELNNLRLANEKKEKEDLIESFIKEGKFSKAMQDTLLSFSIKQINDLGKVTPKMEITTTHKSPEEATGKKWADLSITEKHFQVAKGFTEKKYDALPASKRV